MHRAKAVAPSGGQNDPWQKVVGDLVEIIVGEQGQLGEPLHQIRLTTVQAFRLALGRASLRQLVAAQTEGADDWVNEGGMMDESQYPAFIRREMTEALRRRPTAVDAEFVMPVARRAIEEQLSGPVPPNWVLHLDEVAHVVAALEFKADPQADRAALLDRVMGLAREALGDAPDDTMIRESIVWGGGPATSTELLSRAGLIRCAIRSLDRHDPEVAATVLTLIEAAARAELARDVPGAKSDED